MSRIARIGAAALALLLPACLGQTTKHKKADPKPEPTEPELVEYIRGALLSLSPADGINDNVDVSWNSSSKVLTVTQPSGHCDFFLYALNANQAVWDEFDPSDTYRPREVLLRMTLVSVSGKAGRECYDGQNQFDPTISGNRARFLFSLAKAEETPNFQDKIAKAFQKLVALSGGMPAKDLF